MLQQRDVAVAPDREYMLCVRSAMANAERVMSLFIEVRNRHDARSPLASASVLLLAQVFARFFVCCTDRPILAVESLNTSALR